MTTYTVDISIGEWSDSIPSGRVGTLADPVVVLDSARLSWDMPLDDFPFDAQPNPTTLVLSIWVPRRATGPSLGRGTPVRFEVTHPGPQPADIPEIAWFAGRISDATVTPQRREIPTDPADLAAGTTLLAGVRYDLIATDYRAGLAAVQAWTNFDQQFAPDLVEAIVSGAIGQSPDAPLTMGDYDHSGWLIIGTTLLVRTDPDNPALVPISDALQPVLKQCVGWFCSDPLWFIGYRGGFFDVGVDYTVPPDPVDGHRVAVPGGHYMTWVRPIVAQTVDPDTGAITLPLMYISGGAPNTPGSLLYTLEQPSGAGPCQLTVTDGPFPSAAVIRVPSSAVPLESTSWRQDMSNHPNQVFIHVSDDSPFQLDITPDSRFAYINTVEYWRYGDLVNAYGVVSRTTEYALPPNPEGQTLVPLPPLQPLYAQIGTHADATPSWDLDKITIRFDQIADPTQWPRLFDPKYHAAQTLDRAALRPLYLTDIPEQWNMTRRSEYVGKLVAAELQISGGEIMGVATVLHRLPFSPGIDYPQLVDRNNHDPNRPSLPYPEHHAITFGEIPSTVAYQDLTDAPIGPGIMYADLTLAKGA